MKSIEQLQEFCKSLKATTVDVKWESNLVFSVFNKMYCMYGLENGTISFKVPPEEWSEYVSTTGIIPAPYLAKNGWVRCNRLDLLKKQDLERSIRTSYRMVVERLPKKIQNQLFT
ncbi:YjbR protein [Leptospira broomii serovar Hurstbridge str. 5399]|uniref:YjbR protein n=1 Tax=Leptospira broomii serovar Hurstbridge str. 5399 TaxID=1049789 RepID=T0GG34_9LEPT|nr:MmcQ/YjbR family DNA-binding protein [Leptospira broomii]EQA44358.1 YjbR protein [Leptospira broomii serovar Hurstbridge str. 5399]